VSLISVTKKPFGRRLPPQPRKIITHAPDGLGNGAGGPRLKRSEWIALGALGATVLGVFAAAEALDRYRQCSPPQANAVNAGDKNAKCSSAGTGHGGGGGWGWGGGKSTASSGAHFGGFGEAGGSHGGGAGE
jgi:hypothetical protein